MTMTRGEATMRLLARYGVTTVFGIPGIHMLDLCQGLSDPGSSGAITHVQTRNEQGAGLDECCADSPPMLLMSAELDSRTLGKGWGILHESTEQRRPRDPSLQTPSRWRWAPTDRASLSFGRGRSG